MARRVMATITLQLGRRAGDAGPAGGSRLGGYGVNIIEFTKTYNERTREQVGR